MYDQLFKNCRFEILLPQEILDPVPLVTRWYHLVNKTMHWVLILCWFWYFWIIFSVLCILYSVYRVSFVENRCFFNCSIVCFFNLPDFLKLSNTDYYIVDFLFSAALSFRNFIVIIFNIWSSINVHELSHYKLVIEWRRLN